MNGIKEFREYIKNADDIQIAKVIEFINLLGFFDGMWGNVLLQDSELANESIKYAESNPISVDKYLIENNYISE